MPALSGLNHSFIIICLVNLSDLLLTEMTHPFVSLSLHLLVIRHCSLSFRWVHEFFHLVRVYLVQFRISIRRVEPWLNLFRVNHVDITGLLCFFIEWIGHFNLVGWPTGSAQMQNSLQLLSLGLGRSVWFLVVQNACENLSKLRISFTLHAYALKRVLFNF